MAVNKVIYGDDVIMDVSDTTATITDVKTGKVFYGANGARLTGAMANDILTIPVTIPAGQNLTRVDDSRITTRYAYAGHYFIDRNSEIAFPYNMRLRIYDGYLTIDAMDDAEFTSCYDSTIYLNLIKLGDSEVSRTECRIIHVSPIIGSRINTTGRANVESQLNNFLSMMPTLSVQILYIRDRTTPSTSSLTGGGYSPVILSKEYLNNVGHCFILNTMTYGLGGPDTNWTWKRPTLTNF